MKVMKKTFAVASLFEGKEYISVFSDGTGECVGRIYTEGKEDFKAVAISGAEKGCYSIREAEIFIKRMPRYVEKRKAYKFETYKVNEFGQRSLADTAYSQEVANLRKTKLERCNPGYSFVILPFYIEENKLF